MSRMTAFRNTCKENNLCTGCGRNKARLGKTKCQECHDKIVIAQRKRRERNIVNNVCVACGGPKESSFRRCARCSEINNACSRKAARVLRLSVLTHYSKGNPKCSCCKEQEMDFLTIDHIGGTGAAHRKTRELSSKFGNSIYRWLKAHHLPDGFRVLCMNCNLAIGAYGSCPHQR